MSFRPLQDVSENFPEYMDASKGDKKRYTNTYENAIIELQHLGGDSVTDREMLELILTNMKDMKSDIDNMKSDVGNMKIDIKNVQSGLNEFRTEQHEMNEGILEEVMRVHEIFEQKYNELNKKVS